MALVQEDGTGIKSANSYGSIAEFKSYHTDRGPAPTASDGDITTALIRATDYIDKRFGQRFKGSRAFLNQNTAQSTLTMTAQPADADTVTLGSVTYTFQTILAAAPNNILIGANMWETLSNLVDAVNGDGIEGSNVGAGTVVNPDVSASLLALPGTKALIKALDTGPEGDGLATTATGSAITFNFTTTTGGDYSYLSQGLQFPRANLFDRDGQKVIAVPPKLRFATYEYADRALTAALNPDPSVHSSGRLVSREKAVVGPIETEVEYEPGGVLQIPAYPAADALLAEYLLAEGGAWR